GAAQTIDQVRLYGGHVKWFVDMPVPEVSEDLLRHARAVAGRAVATALARPAGPVHLNFPFREPLLPSTHPDEVVSRLDPFGSRARAGGDPATSRTWWLLARRVPQTPTSSRRSPPTSSPCRAGSSSVGRRTIRPWPRRSPGSPPRSGTPSSPIPSRRSAAAGT